MYVEFLGLPASGKSTLLSRISKNAKANGWEIASQDWLEAKEKNNNSLPVNFRRKSDLRTHLRYLQFEQNYPEQIIFSRETFGQNLMARSWFDQIGGQYMAYQAHIQPKSIKLVDEGFLHRGIYALAQNQNENEKSLQNFIQTLPKLDFVIYTEIDSQKGYERVHSRLKERMGDVAESMITKRLERAHGDYEAFHRRKLLMDRACQMLAAQKTKVINVDVTQTIETSTTKIMDNLAL